ncbi:MAG: DinB family protein [Chitinophagaceae bacterium]
MLIDDFNYTIDIWIKELGRYNFDQLCSKPSENTWSLGQVYMHLIGETEHFLGQIKKCVSGNSNADGQMSPNAKMMFKNNDFPDELIEGPPTNADTPQPNSKDGLIRSLINLKKEFNTVGLLISPNTLEGKTKHPGLNYFNANEWLQFTEMHLRHHLRQKKRIDEFLKVINID